MDGPALSGGDTDSPHWVPWFVSSFIRVFLLAPLISTVVSAPARAGTIVADSGFRPGTDGFRSPTTVPTRGYRNLDAFEVRRSTAGRPARPGRARPAF